MQRLVALAMAFALVGVPGLAAAAGPGSGSADWSVLRFVHEDGHRDSSGNPPKKEATTESDNYRLMNRLRWLPGGPVEYRIVDEPFAAAEGAVDAAVETVDRYVTTRDFVHDDATTQTNPCTGEPNTIRWARLDGPGGTLAFAEVCFNKKSREIGGFVITLDSADGWAIGPDGNPNTFDVESVATHEMGHVAGLDHVKSWKDSCLTMFPFTSPEEIQKRTLGWGDRLGLNVLYNHGDTTPDHGCGV